MVFTFADFKARKKPVRRIRDQKAVDLGLWRRKVAQFVEESIHIARLTMHLKLYTSRRVEHPPREVMLFGVKVNRRTEADTLNDAQNVGSYIFGSHKSPLLPVGTDTACQPVHPSLQAFSGLT